jgi:hypothetical protein
MSGSPDPADFAKTQRLCWLRYAKAARPLRKLPLPWKMDHWLVAVHTKNKMGNVGSSLHCLCDLGISQPPQLDMQRDFGIWQSQGTCFYIDGCASVRTVALKLPIFKQKKRRATISLGLNYCSIGSSQPPFRDTVPLILYNIMAGNSNTWGPCQPLAYYLYIVQSGTTGIPPTFPKITK